MFEPCTGTNTPVTRCRVPNTLATPGTILTIQNFTGNGFLGLFSNTSDNTCNGDPTVQNLMIPQQFWQWITRASDDNFYDNNPVPTTPKPIFEYD